jgi:GTPase SAR1 family protein
MGCGKSTVVKQALSGWALAESTVVSESAHSSFSRCKRYLLNRILLDVNFDLTDIRRTGTLMINPFDQSPLSGGSIILDVFEVEIQTTSSGLVEWPQGLPAIDGIFICYDSSTASSYQPIESLLSELRKEYLIMDIC